jgi:L-threonylcarbamoyladenylate synthase
MHHPDGLVVASDDPEAKERAATILLGGGLVAIPTETVYGLAADIRQPEAIRSVFRAKGRPADHPLIVHIEHFERVRECAVAIPSLAVDAATAFWPGPLTMLLRRSDRISNLVTGGRDTVALRCPANDFTLGLIARVGGGLAAPSANRFGHVSPTRARHVVDDIGSIIDLVVDDGDCRYGIESTIVDMTGSRPQILRAGALTQEDLERTLDVRFHAATGPSRAPGMLLSHYAPRAAVHLVSGSTEAADCAGHLGRTGHHVRILEHTENLSMYAATLYHQMRAADDDGVDDIVAVLPPRAGLGAAIADRLEKSAVRREDGRA